MERIQFEPCSNLSYPDIHFYIHGYAAFKNLAEKEQFKQQLRTIDGVAHVLVAWPSEHFLPIVTPDAFDKIGQLAEEFLGRYISASNRQHFKATNFFKEQAENAVAVLPEASSHFKKMKARADELSEYLFDAIYQFLQQHQKLSAKVNIIGHSLGARMLSLALHRQQAPLTFHLNDVLLMGGAINVSEVHWEKALSHPKGKLVNAHSKDDYILKIAPELHQTIGNKPILTPSSKKLENVEFAWGHSDYWPNLATLWSHMQWKGKPDTASNTESASFVHEDTALFSIINHATPIEKEGLANILAKYRSTEITADEQDPFVLTQAIQYLGGDTIVNRFRGHGVSYATIVEDVAENLGINTHNHTILQLWEQSIFQKVLPHIPLGKNWEQMVHAIPEIEQKHAGLTGVYNRENRKHTNAFGTLLHYLYDVSTLPSGPAYGALTAIVCLISWIRAKNSLTHSR